MDYVRSVVESVLRGSMSRASFEHAALSDLAEMVLDSCVLAHCASPYVLAERLDLSVIEADLPPPVCVCVDDSTVIVRPVADVRERGLLVFRGIARYTIGRYLGAHTEADAIVMAAELAAPSGLVVRRGVEAVAARQLWVPIWFLRAWDEYLCPPVPTSRTA